MLGELDRTDVTAANRGRLFEPLKSCRADIGYFDFPFAASLALASASSASSSERRRVIIMTPQRIVRPRSAPYRPERISATSALKNTKLIEIVVVLRNTNPTA